MSPELRPRTTRKPFQVGQVPGVNGIVLSDFSLWNGLTFIVEGQRIRPRGVGRRVTLPGTTENVEARVRGGLPGAQKLLVDGHAYATGPEAPFGLRIFVLLPLLTMLLAKPSWSLPAALLATNINIAVVRSSQPQRVRLALMVAVTGSAVAVNLALAAAIGPLFDV